MAEDADDVRCWLVEREYTDKGLLTLTYATPDGTRRLQAQQSLHAPDPTAARDVAPDRLEAVGDDAVRERYAREVERLRERHDPDDRV